MIVGPIPANHPAIERLAAPWRLRFLNVGPLQAKVWYGGAVDAEVVGVFGVVPGGVGTSVTDFYVEREGARETTEALVAWLELHLPRPIIAWNNPRNTPLHRFIEARGWKPWSVVHALE